PARQRLRAEEAAQSPEGRDCPSDSRAVAPTSMTICGVRPGCAILPPDPVRRHATSGITVIKGHATGLNPADAALLEKPEVNRSSGPILQRHKKHDSSS